MSLAPLGHQLSPWTSRDPKSTNPSARQQLPISWWCWEVRRARGVPADPPPSWRHPGLPTFLLSCVSQRRAICTGSRLPGHHRGSSWVPPRVPPRVCPCTPCGCLDASRGGIWLLPGCPGKLQPQGHNKYLLSLTLQKALGWARTQPLGGYYLSGASIWRKQREDRKNTDPVTCPCGGTVSEVLEPALTGS